MKKITYTEAYNQLTEIISEIENNEISIDQLAEKVKRANELIKICNNKLQSIEGDVNEVLTEMENK